MGVAILENMPVTRSEDSTLFREISRFVLTERPLAWNFAKVRAKCYGRTQPWLFLLVREIRTGRHFLESGENLSKYFKVLSS